MLRERWGISLDWDQLNSLAEFFIVRLEIGGNYIKYLVIVVKFMGLGGVGFMVNLIRYCKSFYRITFFTMLMLF